jgi:hypothetical protein
MSITDTALRLINEYGVALTLARKTPGTIDPVSGLLTGNTEDEYQIHGVIQSDEKNLDAMAKTFMISADFAPQLGDVLTDEEGAFAVSKIHTESFKGVAVYYLIGLLK